MFGARSRNRRKMTSCPPGTATRIRLPRARVGPPKKKKSELRTGTGKSVNTASHPGPTPERYWERMTKENNTVMELHLNPCERLFLSSLVWSLVSPLNVLLRKKDFLDVLTHFFLTTQVVIWKSQQASAQKSVRLRSRLQNIRWWEAGSKGRNDGRRRCFRKLLEPNSASEEESATSDVKWTAPRQHRRVEGA